MKFPKNNIIDDWLNKNSNPEIDKLVEQQAKELMKQEQEDWFEQVKNNPPSFWRKLKWELADIKYWPRNLKMSIKSVLYWFPIIWKDRNWDYRYIYTILQHKLKAQSKYIGERDIHTTAKRDAEIMMTCVRLIDKVADEFYAMEYLDYEKSKHWFEPCRDKEGYSTWESEQLSENFDDYFKKYPLIYKRVMNGEGPYGLESKHHIAMNISDINQQRAHDLLFKIMEENILSWWD